MADPADCERAERELADAFPSFHVVRSAPFLLEIMDGSVSKASGIAVLLGNFGRKPEAARSVGAQYNVTRSNRADGLYWYLKQAGLIAG